MEEETMDELERAREFVRGIIVDIFHQEIDEEAIEVVAKKVLKALPVGQGRHD